MPSEDDIASHVAAAAAAALTYGGTVSRVSAAASWKWDVRALPDLPHITVPRGRRLDDIDLRAVSVRRMNLPPDDIADHVTVPGRTLVDCCRSLPFAQSLAIANSALRGGFPKATWDRLAAQAKGPGSIRVRQVHAHADGRVANVFESALQALCLSVTGLHVLPQVPIQGAGWFLGRPDFVDEELRIIVEAESFGWHGHRSALVADAQRYNGFIVEGWLVLRFTWEDVMFHPELVCEALARAVAVARTNRGLWSA